MSIDGQTSPPELLDTHQKALQINLESRRYGTFAEIGAGQEVVRWFFRVGGASGTIAKSISASDMTVSDAYYGPCERYVCRQRLQSMLDNRKFFTRSRFWYNAEAFARSRMSISICSAALTKNSCWNRAWQVSRSSRFLKSR